MGAVQAIVEIVTSLGWPLVVLVGVVLLRPELKGLLDRIHRGKVGPFELEFAEKAADAENLAEIAIPDAPKRLPESSPPDLVRNPTLDDLLAEADRHPVGAVIRVWGLAERAASVTIQQDTRQGNGSPLISQGLRVIHAARLMQRQGWFKPDVTAVAWRLTRLHDLIVRDLTLPDRAAARSFVEAAWRLVAAFTEANAKVAAGEDPRGIFGPVAPDMTSSPFLPADHPLRQLQKDEAAGT